MRVYLELVASQTLRTLGVWMLSLFMYYVLKWQGPDSAGEQWTVYSWCVRVFLWWASLAYLFAHDCRHTSRARVDRVELLGFVLMVFGTLAVRDHAVPLVIGHVRAVHPLTRASRLHRRPPNSSQQYKKLISIPLRALYATEQREHAAAYKSPYMSTLHK